jgi:hypothetical protein
MISECLISFTTQKGYYLDFTLASLSTTSATKQLPNAKQNHLYENEEEWLTSLPYKNNGFPTGQPVRKWKVLTTVMWHTIWIGLIREICQLLRAFPHSENPCGGGFSERGNALLIGIWATITVGEFLFAGKA